VRIGMTVNRTSTGNRSSTCVAGGTEGLEMMVQTLQTPTFALFSTPSGLLAGVVVA